MRPSHAERKAARKAGKRLLRELAPSARVAALATEPGDEILVFLPSGRLAHLLREDEVRFRVREMEDFDAAVNVGMRWAAAERAAEAVQ